MCVITAGGAGDVMKALSWNLHLRCCRSSGQKTSTATSSPLLCRPQPRQRPHVGCNGLMISSCPVARGLRCFGVLLEGIAAIHDELTARAAVDGLSGLSAAGRSMLLLCTSLSSRCSRFSILRAAGSCSWCRGDAESPANDKIVAASGTKTK